MIDMIDRRSVLKASGLGLTAACLGIVPRVKSKFLSIRNGLVGAIGVSQNPSATKSLLDCLETASTEPMPAGVETFRDTFKDTVFIYTGDYPEFNALHAEWQAENPANLLMRMMLSKEDRIQGIKEIYSRINYGNISGAVIEGNNLWLWRNSDEEQIFVVDMRPTLGQIFWCTKPQIWRDAISNCLEILPYIPKDQMLIAFPKDQVWSFIHNPEKDFEGCIEWCKGWKWHIRKFKIERTKYYEQQDPAAQKPAAA